MTLRDCLYFNACLKQALFVYSGRQAKNLILFVITFIILLSLVDVISANPNEPPPADAWRRGPVRIMPSRNAAPIRQTVDGRDCVETTGKLISRKLCFTIDDDYAFEIDETVEIEVEYDSTYCDKFGITYDSNFESKLKKGVRRSNSTAKIEPDKSKRWARHTFQLKRARFANSMPKGSDFMITPMEGQAPRQAQKAGQGQTGFAYH